MLMHQMLLFSFRSVEV